MYFCLLVVHRTLLNSYVMMRKKNMKERQKKVDVYFWTTGIVYSVSQLFETIVVCIDYEVLNDRIWNYVFIVKAEMIIVASLFFNTLIAIKVLP